MHAMDSTSHDVRLSAARVLVPLVGLGLAAGFGCGSTLIDDQARPEMLVLSCSREQVACHGSCLTCQTPEHASATCVESGCGFACDAGYNQCGARSCVAESAASCGPSCTDCTGKAPVNAVAICNEQHACDFECQPGFLRSGAECRRAAALSAGFEHTCALTTDGRVKCWGSNERGQLGDGTSYSSVIPVDPALPGSAQALSAGYYHTCAVVAGQVYCWGNGTVGELGDGRMTTSATPVVVPGLSNVEKVSAGGEGDPGFINMYAHTCAISGGEAWCWGSNGSGQLGDGTSTSRSTPVRVTILPPGVLIDSIAIGERHTCALTYGGAVYCWGANDSGQLGIGSESPQTYPAAPTITSGATAIATGEAHSCAIVNRDVLCWGLNTSFQVNPEAAPASYPDVVDLAMSTVRPTSLAAGRDHTCAVDSSAVLTPVSVYCFGANDGDQLGVDDPQAKQSVVPIPEPMRAVSAGAGHTCVLTAAGGVQCWGENEYGQLGSGTTGVDSWLPTYVSGR